MGTFKSGVANIQLHHWSNAKPAQTRADQADAEMPVRGRPKKLAPGTDSADTSPLDTPVPPVEPSTSVNHDGQSSTDRSGPPKSKTTPNSKINKLPERRSARIAARDHATSIGAIQVLSSGPPKGRPFSAGNSNVVTAKAWSASKTELDALNSQINRKFGA